MTSLTVRQLAKSFGAKTVLSHLDLTVTQASIAAILGPSGCGKTTLLRIIAGFVEPDAGVVQFGDQTVVGAGRSVPPQQRRVGYVAQEGALFPHLDVARNITFGLPYAERRGERLGEMLDLVELPQAIAAQYPHELSGGQQQRVALARALAPDPAVILLDEPFSSLDAGLREATGRSVVRALRAAGATAILVTHDQSEALSLADQVAVMRDGRLAQVASPVELYRSPVDPGVAQFVGGAVVLPAHVSGDVAHCALGEVRVASGHPTGPAQVLVRPEQLEVLTGPGEGVQASVAEVSYFGHDASVHLDLLPTGLRVVARISGPDVPRVGDVVRVRVGGDGIVFPGETASVAELPPEEPAPAQSPGPRNLS